MLWRVPPTNPRRPVGYIEPCVPSLADGPPKGPQWIHEIKHDGYRLIARKQDRRVRLFTRHGYDWSDRYPLIVAAMAAIRATTVTIDGEAVYCDESGVSVFDTLLGRQRDDRVVLYAFDLLEVNGADYRPRSLEVRKVKLAKLIVKAPAGLQFNEHIEGDGTTVFEHACKLGLEGIVCKRRDSVYRSGRTKTWIKIKNPNSPAMLRLDQDGS